MNLIGDPEEENLEIMLEWWRFRKIIFWSFLNLIEMLKISDFIYFDMLVYSMLSLLDYVHGENQG